VELAGFEPEEKIIITIPYGSRGVVASERGSFMILL